MEAWLVLARALPAPPRPRSQPASRRRTARRIVVSRVVMGQVWRHWVFLQAFREGRARDGICGNSYFIASADVRSRTLGRRIIFRDRSQAVCVRVISHSPALATRFQD